MVAPSQALHPEGKKEHADTDVELQLPEEKKALTEVHDDEYQASPYHGTTVPVIRPQRQRAKAKRRLWLQILLFIGMILGLTLCVLASIRLYKGMYVVKDYQGVCGVGIIDMSRYNQSSDAVGHEALKQKSTVAPPVKWQYKENVDINGLLEKLTVPQQEHTRPATFLHDFDRNHTAIRDEAKQLCFLVPFINDFISGKIPKPAQFSDMLRSFEGGMPPAVPKDEFFSVGSPLDFAKQDLGAAFTDLCKDMKSYSATPVKADHVAAVSTTTAAPTTPMDDFLDYHYMMYPGGDAVYSYSFSFGSTDPFYDAGF